MKSKDLMVMEEKLSLVEHLTELRNRIIKAVLAFIICSGAIFFVADQLYYYLTEPLGVTKLVYIAPAEGFLSYLRLAVYGGLVLSSPVVFYQFLRFVLPGLYSKERRVIFTLIPGAFLLMCGGVAFGYFVVLPFALKYLLTFGSMRIEPMLSVHKYIGFVSTTLLILGCIFELPLVMVGLTKLGIVTPKFLRKNRKYAIVVAVALGAVLTPPDIFTQLLMAGPLILLYEASIWISYLFWRKKKKDKEKESMMQDV